MSGVTNASFDAWKDAVGRGDTFSFARVTGDRDLIRRVRLRLRNAGADALSRDMLALADLEQGINGLVEKAAKLDQLEIILNDTNAPDRSVIERLSEAFYG